MTQPRTRGRPARTDAVPARDDILRRAFAAFAAHGYDGVSLRQLAADCGVSDSLLHHHFGSKQDLWQETADCTVGPLMAALTANLELLAQQGDAASTLRQNLPQALKRLLAEPEVLAFIFREGEADDNRGAYLRTTYMRPYLDRLDTLFTQAVAAGHFRPVPAAARHVLITGFLRALVIPGVLRIELAPHLASPDTLNRFVDDTVAVLIKGFTTPFSALSQPASGVAP